MHFFSPGMAAFAQEPNEKVVSQEFLGGSTTIVDIEIIRHIAVEIVPWDEPNIKIVYRYNPDWYKDLSGVALSELGFGVRQYGSRQLITVSALKHDSINTTVISSPADYIIIDGKKYYKVASIGETTTGIASYSRSSVTFYIPKNKKLVLKLLGNGNVTITGDLIEADITFQNRNSTTLKAKSIKKLYLKARYPKASFDTIGEAAIDIVGGKLVIKKIGRLNAKTSYTSVQIALAEEINFLSTQSDEYNIDVLGSLRGSKEYGVCKIGTLKKGIDLAGSTDILISDIRPESEQIKIKSSQGTLALPVKNLKNYSIDINAPGAILLLTDDIRRGIIADTNGKDQDNLARFLGPGMVKINSNVGDVKSKHTVFEINCQNCTINFRSQE